ncbi:MAG TPA: phytase [Gammaproteobacteria bacterium]|nr:phytase [Gammaproteobacteria bacterium]
MQLNAGQQSIGTAQVKPVVPSVETDAFSGSGDIADDSAIWLNTADPSQSVVIGDNKDESGGLGVFDLSGRTIQFRQDGKIGNVDLRYNFHFGEHHISIVGANNVSDDTIILYGLNPETRQIEPIPGNRPTVKSNYGFCFYHSQTSEKLYAFVTQEDGGSMEQHELVVNGSNIDTAKVRDINVGGQSEGCVADDELGYLYVGEEEKGIWKYSAEPTGGSTRTAVDSVGAGRLTADVEGLALAYGSNGTGYLFVSSQGDSTFSVYQREGNNAFVKSFEIAAGNDIDEVSGTDGIDVVNANLGPSFPRGLFVAHDKSNAGGAASNLKYVPLNLIIDMKAPPSMWQKANAKRLSQADFKLW